MDEADRRMLLDDPALFIVTYFSHRISRLEDFHLRLIRAATEEARALILYPAGHGKTTLVSTLLPIWEVCKNPDTRIAIIGKNDTEVEGIMQVIQAEMTVNDELVRDFGPFRPPPEDNKPWALGRMSVAGRQIRAKEPTITVFGSGAKTVLGYRTDHTICDDVITDKNSATPDQREKIKNWFDLCVETGPEHIDSRLTVVGTRFDPADLYGDLEELEDEGANLWYTMREDAIVDLCTCGHGLRNHMHGSGRCSKCRKCEVATPSGDWESLWGVRWPRKRLMQQKVKVGTLNFNKRYRNIAVDASRMVFKEEYVKGGSLGGITFPGCLDRSYKVGDVEDNWRKVGGFDPAVGTTRTAKFCAHTVLALGSCVDHDRCFWVVDLERLQLTLPQQVDMILAKHDEYKLMMSIVEANSYQAGLCQAIDQKMIEAGQAFKVDAHYTSRQNKPDPELGVQSMSPWFERGAVHIPWGDAHSQRKMAQLVEELIMYPGKTTDTVLSFWFAWRALQIASPKFESYNRLTKEAPLWGRRLNRRTIVNPAYIQQ